MCLCFRGREGKFLCCSVLVGMHCTGPISIGMFAYYMTLFINSSENDQFNWVILVWTFLIGLPRMIFYFCLFADSIFRRKLYAMVLAGTTLLELLIYVVNQFIIFSHDKDYCSRVYAVSYMINQWGIYCDWAITIYEICTTFSVLFYITASMGAFDHYHCAFHDHRLEAKERQRMEVCYHEEEDDTEIKKDYEAIMGNQNAN